MGVVALDADIKTLVRRHRLTAMAAFADLLDNIFMTVRALFGLKKFLQIAIDVHRIRMATFFNNFAVAFLAGQLAVNRNMETLVINQP